MPQVRNLANVRAMPDGAYLCDVEMLDAVGEWVAVPYIARPNDPAAANQWILAEIETGAHPIAPFVPPPAPAAPPRQIAKATIYRRATDAELTLLDATVAALPLRDRLLWQDAAGGRVLVEEVQPFFVQAFGTMRAAELLAA